MCYAGLTSGLLRLHGDIDDKAAPTIDDTGIFRALEAVSSVGGGSWYFAMLAYSRGFGEIVDSLGGGNVNISSVLGAAVLDPMLGLAGPVNRFHGLVSLGTAMSMDQADAEHLRMISTLREMGYFWNGSKSWVDFSALLLSTAANVSESVQFGSEDVAKWSHGKTWLVDHSLVAASGRAPARVWGSSADEATYSVAADSVDLLPVYVPAKFSVTMGSGRQAPAPLPYLSRGSKDTMHSMEYRNTRSSWNETTDVEISTAEIASAPASSSVSDQGMLPLHAVTAASSAAGGVVCLSSVLGAPAGVQLAPWMTSASEGRAFELGEALVAERKPAVDLAGEKVRAVIDGAYTDDTGIGQLVAGGATEIFSFLDIGSGNWSWSLCKLFANAEAERGIAPGVPLINFQIFAEEALRVQEKLIDLPRIVHRDSTHLSFVSVGTISATTVENKWFGTQPGQKVAIHVLCVSSRLTLQDPSEIHEYGVLVEDIIKTVSSSDNKDLVRKEVLDPLRQVSSP